MLLDESKGRRFGRLLVGHDVASVDRLRWKGLKNGALLRRAADEGFEALITADRSIEYQQNVASLGLGVVVLVARSNRLADHQPLVPDVLSVLGEIQPGQVVRVGTAPQLKNPRSSSAR